MTDRFVDDRRVVIDHLGASSAPAPAQQALPDRGHGLGQVGIIIRPR
jgi:hypothetical protein